jgi:hypothetical protein
MELPGGGDDWSAPSPSPSGQFLIYTTNTAGYVHLAKNGYLDLATSGYGVFPVNESGRFRALYPEVGPKSDDATHGWS